MTAALTLRKLTASAFVIGFLLVTFLMISPARADTIGTVTFLPSKGDANTVLDIETSSSCPGGSSSIVKMFGKGFPKDGQNVTGNQPLTIFNPTAAGGYYVPLVDTLSGFADIAGVDRLIGRYDFVFYCQTSPLDFTSTGEFIGSLTFKGKTWTADMAAPPPTPSSAPTQNNPSPSGGASTSPGGSDVGEEPPPATTGEPTTSAEPAEPTSGFAGSGAPPAGETPDPGSEPTTGDPNAALVASQAPADGGTSRAPWIVGGVAVVIVTAVGVTLVARRS